MERTRKHCSVSFKPKVEERSQKVKSHVPLSVSPPLSPCHPSRTCVHSGSLHSHPQRTVPQGPSPGSVPKVQEEPTQPTWTQWYLNGRVAPAVPRMSVRAGHVSCSSFKKTEERGCLHLPVWPWAAPHIFTESSWPPGE